MPPKARFIIRFIAIAAIIVAAIQPFNWFCQITQKCRPFYFSYYIPKKQGILEINVLFETTTYRENIIFSPNTPFITTVANKKNTVTFKVKNLNNKKTLIRPKLIVEPKYAEKYLTKYECLCMTQFKLKPKKEKDLKMEFEIDRKIIFDDKFRSSQDKTIKIRYKI